MKPQATKLTISTKDSSGIATISPGLIDARKYASAAITAAAAAAAATQHCAWPLCI
jgi:hypothetical protein